MAGTVIPGIMNDFDQMLSGSQRGKAVQEEYRLEDGRACVFISGRKLDGNTVSYDRVEVTEGKTTT